RSRNRFRRRRHGSSRTRHPVPPARARSLSRARNPEHVMMPDSDQPSGAQPPSDTRNLPVPVPRPRAVAREGGESWFGRALRAMFGWKSGSIRADLKDVLDTAAPSESGFSPAESRMLKNILSLRERRIAEIRIPRADIIAVQQDISLGDLLRMFE